jgi:hypothetical protein
MIAVQSLEGSFTLLLTIKFTGETKQEETGILRNIVSLRLSADKA